MSPVLAEECAECIEIGSLKRAGHLVGERLHAGECVDHAELAGEVGVFHGGDLFAGDARLARVAEDAASPERLSCCITQWDALHVCMGGELEQERATKCCCEVVLKTARDTEILDFRLS